MNISFPLVCKDVVNGLKTGSPSVTTDPAANPYASVVNALIEVWIGLDYGETPSISTDDGCELLNADLTLARPSFVPEYCRTDIKYS